MRLSPFKNTCKGFTLVEAMISLVILSIGLLGVAGMQSMGLRLNYDALQRSQATTLAYDISEKMRMDSNNALLIAANPYAGTYAKAVAANTCNTASVLVVEVLNCWQVTLRDLLPAGSITITAPTAANPNQIGLNISWSDNWIKKGGTTAETSFQNFTFQIHDGS